LRNRAVSVQTVLDELNDAGNGLNVVVLDACRDNPFGWSRSGTRGLTIVTRQPSDSIIVYATSAGQRASDGQGRNGLFTGQLINNLATPGIEVNEVFRRTGQDVAKASNNNQIPAIYSQFFGTAFLGTAPVDWDPTKTPGSATVIIGREKEIDPAKLWSVGASAGSSFAAPWLIGTVRGTIAPFQYQFFELGFDAGLMAGSSDVNGYYSLYPFVHYAFFWPTDLLGGKAKAGFYAGAGAGYLIAKYTFAEGDSNINTLALDAVAGITLFDMIDISYTFRTDFTNAGNKVSLGYFYRF